MTARPVTLRYALASIAIALAVLALKGTAWWITGSAALFSDAAESIVNVAAAAAAYAALRTAARPADAGHPYGHGKAEYLSAVLEGALIVVAALAILREAALALLDPRPITSLGLGLAINAGAGVVNALWCVALLRAGKRHRSPALAADGRHLAADVASSAGVVVGLGAAYLTGFAILDPLIAALVALHVLWSGWRLLRESVGGLMDEAAAPELQARIGELIAQNGGGALQAHDLKTRQAGARTFIEFHLVVPGGMTVASAHAICDRIEDALEKELGPTSVTIHVEPAEKAKRGEAVVGAFEEGSAG